MTELNFRAFGSKLSTSGFAVFKSLYENALNIMIEKGPQATYEKQLVDLMNECNLQEMESVADSIKEIITRRVEFKKGEFQIFSAFFTSICIENGTVKYGLPEEIADAMRQVRSQGIC